MKKLTPHALVVAMLALAPVAGGLTRVSMPPTLPAPQSRQKQEQAA